MFSCLSSAINLFLKVPFSRSILAFPVATLVVSNTIPNSSHILPNCVINSFLSLALILFAENELLLSAFIFSGIP